MPAQIFSFSEYWWFYAAFTLLVLLLIAVDLAVFHRTAHKVSYREALIWSVVWISLALVFNYAFYHYCYWKFTTNPQFVQLPGFNPSGEARRLALEFLAGYLVEKSLSVDNIFVFVLVFKYFGVAPQYQHRVLFFGILGALVFRAIFIALGAFLMRYHFVVMIFGVFLVFTGVKMMFTEDKKIEPDRNPVIRLLKRLMHVSTTMVEQRFFVRQHGRLYITPLLVCLVFLEMTDIVFAIDSVPAIFALTREPLIVFTSNIFAILGLRSLYFLLAGAMEQFHFLKLGLAVILVFVGLKMTVLDSLSGGKFPINASLGIIGTVLLLSIAASFILPRSGDASK